MKYFLHDTNAFQDEKVTELFMAHGYEGLGLFFSILEKLAQQEKPVKTAVLKQQLSVGKKLEKCWSFLESLQLISSNNGETFNDNLLKFSEKYQVSKEKNREKVSQWREKQLLKESVTGYVPVRNAPKGKERKGNTTDVVVGDGGPALPVRNVKAEMVASRAATDGATVQRPAESPLAKPQAFAAICRDLFPEADLGWYAREMLAKAPADGMPATSWRNWIINFLKNEKASRDGLVKVPGHGQTPNEIPGNWNPAEQGPYVPPLGMGIPHPSSYLKPDFLPK